MLILVVFFFGVSVPFSGRLHSPDVDGVGAGGGGIQGAYILRIFFLIQKMPPRGLGRISL